MSPHQNILRDIPRAAYGHTVNGTPTLEIGQERKAVTTDTESCTTNETNPYATETTRNATSPLALFQLVIGATVEIMMIVNGLQILEIQ